MQQQYIIIINMFMNVWLECQLLHRAMCLLWRSAVERSFILHVITLGPHWLSSATMDCCLNRYVCAFCLCGANEESAWVFYPSVKILLIKLCCVSILNHKTFVCVCVQVQYTAYGEVYFDSNPDFVLVIGFHGGLYDPLTRLLHFGDRDYDIPAGR